MKRYLITGAASGIGLATALRLAEDHGGGCWLALVDRDEQALAEAASQVAAIGADSSTICVDLSHADAFEAIASEVGTTLDGVVSNAGVMSGGTLLDTTENGFDKVMDINLRATWRLARVTYPMLKAAQGAFVATASILAREACAGVGAYAISKAALVMMVRQLSLEWAADGIRCNTIAPGSTWSNMTAAGFANEAHRKQREAGIPLGRLGSAGDCADGIAFLLSDRARYVTGTTLTIDGGFSNALMLATKAATGTG